MEMKRKISAKRLLSLLLAVIMVVGMLPTAVFAVDTSVGTNDEYKNAVNTASTGDTITLTADIQLAGEYAITKDITIDLKGHTLKGHENQNAIVCQNGSKVTVMNGTIAGSPTTSGSCVNANGSKLTLQGVTLTGKNAVSVQNSGNVTIKADSKIETYYLYWASASGNALTVRDAIVGVDEVNYKHPHSESELNPGFEKCGAAQIGTKRYMTLAEAVAAAVNGDTVELLCNASGRGIMTNKSDKSITIDFGGYTYTCTGPAVGSSGTKSQAFHLENRETVLKNGTITSVSESGVKMLVQNYSSLTLENITLDGSYLDSSNMNYYTLSNCANVHSDATTTIKADTEIIAHLPTSEHAAFAFDSDQNAVVNVEGGTIKGNVEVTTGALNVTGGSFDGEIKPVLGGYQAGNVKVTGGLFTNPALDVDVKNDDGTSYVPAKSSDVTLMDKAVVADEANANFFAAVENLKTEYPAASYIGAVDVYAVFGGQEHPDAKYKTLQNYSVKTDLGKLPAKEDYYLFHWDSEHNRFDEAPLDATVGLKGLSFRTDDFTAFAIFTTGSTTFNVAFEYNYIGPEGRYTNQSVVNGMYAARPADPVREGYVFKGWYTKAEPTEADEPFNFATSIIAPTTLYAKWEQDLVTITEPTGTITGVTPDWRTIVDEDTATAGVQVTRDTTQKFTVTLDEGYDPATVVVEKDGVALSAIKIEGNKYTYQFVATDDHVLSITEPSKYQYTVTLPTANGITTAFTAPATLTDAQKTSKAVTVETGTTVGYTVTAGTGVVIEAVFENGVKVSTEAGKKTYVGQIAGIAADTVVTVDAGNAKFYNVNYVVDEANYASFQVEANSAVPTVTAPTKIGYTFSDWGTHPTTVTGDLVIKGRFAPKTNQIQFQKNAPDTTIGHIPENQTKTYDQVLVLSDLVPTRTGYTFKGWALSADGPVVYQPGATFSTNIDTDIDLYAIWEMNTYTVTLPTGTGYSVSTTQSTTVDYNGSFTFNVKVDRDYATTAPVVKANTNTLTNPTPVANDDGSKTYTYTISNIKADQIVNITVAKNKTYTVTFKTVTDDATPVVADYLTQEVEDTYCATRPADPIVEGYTFEGWYTDNTFATEYDFATPVTKPTPVYGKMVAIKPVVTIPASVTGADVALTDTDALAATAETHEHTYKADCTFTVTVREGYDASAMQVGANGYALAPTDISGNVYTYRVAGVTEDTTITVVGIVRKTVTVTYNANARDDVSGMPEAQVINYYVQALTDNSTIIKQYPTRTGYTFLGWDKNSEATTATYAAGTEEGQIKHEDGAIANFQEDTTLYAIWKANATRIQLAVSDVAKAEDTDSDSIDDTWYEYEGETVTLTATLDTAVSTGTVIFYQNGKVIGQQAANGSDTYTFEAATTEYAVDGSAKDVYKVAYKAEGDEGFSNSESAETEIKVLSTAITWKLDSDKIAEMGNVLTIKKGAETVDTMDADTQYTLELPEVDQLGGEKLTVDQNYTVKWQYKDANNTWVDYGTTTGNTVTIQPEYSKYSFRALVYPVGAPTSHYTKAAAYDDEKNLNGYAEFLVTVETKAVVEQAVTVKITASDEISSTTAVDVYQLNEITLSAVVEPTNADSTKQPSGTVTFYYQVGTGEVVEIDSAELKNESGKMTAKITTSDLPVDATTNGKQDVTVIAVYNGDKTFKKSNTYNAETKKLGETVVDDANTDVTVYSSVVYTDEAENTTNTPDADAIKISVSAGSLAANETNVTLSLADIYTLDHSVDVSKLTFGTDYTVQWQKLSNAAAYAGKYGEAATPWADIDGATGVTCPLVVEQGAAYRAVVTVKDTPIAKGSFTSVDQDVDGRPVYYSNVLVAGAGNATVTVNVNTSNTADGYEGIVEGEKVTISTFVSGATNTTPISKMTVTIEDNGGSEVFKQEKTDVNGYSSFDWTPDAPGYYTLTVKSESTNGYEPTTIIRELIVRDDNYTINVTDTAKTYNGKAQGATAAVAAMDIEGDLAQKAVVIYYYSDAEMKNMVEPKDAAKYYYKAILPESAYWTEKSVTGEFVISPRQVEVADLVAQAKVYDGTTDANILEIVLEDAAVGTDGLPTDNTGVLNGDSIYAVGTGYTSSANAGTVSLKVRNVELKGDDAANYVLDGEYAGEDFTIMRNQLKGDIADATYAYGTKEVPADDIIVIDQQGNDFTDYDVTYYYHNGDGVEKVKGLDAKGLYTVIVTPKDTANYKGGAAQKVYVADAAADAAPTAPTSATIKITNTVELYGGNKGIAATASNGTVTNVFYNDSTEVPTAAGRYLVKVTTSTGDNAYGLYTIVKANPVLSLTATDVEYNSAQRTGTPALTGATADYYTYTGGTIQGVSYTAPTEVGDYVVTAHVNETANNAAHEVSATFKITPKALTITADSYQRHQYGEYPQMTAAFEGLATGGVAADTSLRDVQIQPEFVFDNYSNTALDQVGTYKVTPVAALARNYDVTYVDGQFAVTAAEANPELAIHGMIDNGTGAEIAYYGDKIQLYAYGSQKSNVINNSSKWTWSVVTGLAEITEEGLLTVTGVGVVTVKLTRGEGAQSISTEMTFEAKKQEVQVSIPEKNNTYSGVSQNNGAAEREGLDAMFTSVVAAADIARANHERTDIGSQITTGVVKSSVANYCSETYGGLYTINDKDITVAPIAQTTVYGTPETYDAENDATTGGAYTETSRVNGKAALTNAKVASVADLYSNLDVLDGYEILVTGTEDINYNVKYITAAAAPDAAVTAKDLTITTGALNGTQGMTTIGTMSVTKNSAQNNSRTPANGAAVSGATFAKDSARMFGEPNQVMDYTIETFVEPDSLADVTALEAWLDEYSKAGHHNVSEEANVSYSNRETALEGHDVGEYKINCSADNIAFANYTETYTEGTQDIYQRPITMVVPESELTVYCLDILTSGNAVDEDKLIQLIYDNYKVDKKDGIGGLAELLGHKIEDLDLTVESATYYNATGKVEAKIKIGNQNYWLNDTNTFNVEVEVETSKVEADYGTLYKNYQLVTMYQLNEEGHRVGKTKLEGNVKFYVYEKNPADGGKGYSFYKYETPIREVDMVYTGSTGVYRATYAALPAGQYVTIAIAEGYTIIE